MYSETLADKGIYLIFFDDVFCRRKRDRKYIYYFVDGPIRYIHRKKK